MKICYVGDANSIHLQRWVDWFAREHEVSIISTTDGPGLTRQRVATLTHERLVGSRLAGSLLAVQRRLRELRPDVLHCHYINEAGWFGAACGWRPLVITAWGSDVYRARESRLARYLNPWALRRADWVTCDSRDQAGVIRSWGAKRVSVIGWGVDRREFHPGVDGTALRAWLRIPRDAPVLLSPRRWHSNCNVPTVIAAHSMLDDGAFLILKRSRGAEPQHEYTVERAIAASPARDRIRIVGELRAQELPSLYGAADAVVSLCATDGTPVSLLEAMACGAPVIALDVPSVAEWVADPGGALLDRADPGLLAAAVRHFFGDARLRKRAAEHNAAIVSSRADREREFARMSEIYQELAGSRKTQESRS